jgi:hypothetical protein
MPSRRNKLYLIAVFMLASNATLQAGVIRPLVMSGTEAPGSSNGEVFSGFGVPYLNNSRQIAFTATLAGETVSANNRDGIWSSGNGALTMVARAGDSAPSSPDTLKAFDSLRLNNAGKVAFHAQLIGPPFRGDAILSDRSGALKIVVGGRDLAPGEPNGNVFKDLAVDSSLAFNTAGNIGFTARTFELNSTNYTSWTGIWVDRNGALDLVARQSTPIPGPTDPYEAMTFSYPSLKTLNERGEAAFSSQISSRLYSFGLFAERDGSIKTLALDPSAPTDPKQLAVDDQGFSTFAAISRFSPYSYHRIWSERQPEEPLVDWQVNEPYKVIGFSNYSPADKLGFVAIVAGVNRRDEIITPFAEWLYFVYSEFGERTSIVAKTGDAAPGTDENVFFSGFQAGFNRDGRTVLLGKLAGPSINATNSIGLWIQDDAGMLELIARAGSDFEVSPGDVRTISTLAYAGGSMYASGLSGGLNDFGDVLFRSTFTDGTSGIFLYSIVPEPHTNTLTFISVVIPFFYRLRFRLRTHRAAHLTRQ